MKNRTELKGKINLLATIGFLMTLLFIIVEIMYIGLLGFSIADIIYVSLFGGIIYYNNKLR